MSRYWTAQTVATQPAGPGQHVLTSAIVGPRQRFAARRLQSHRSRTSFSLNASVAITNVGPWPSSHGRPPRTIQGLSESTRLRTARVPR